MNSIGTRKCKYPSIDPSTFDAVVIVGQNLSWGLERPLLVSFFVLFFLILYVEMDKRHF
jgi:hypothetical protein